jgi:hypothetical protein
MHHDKILFHTLLCANSRWTHPSRESQFMEVQIQVKSIKTRVLAPTLDLQIYEFD